MFVSHKFISYKVKGADGCEQTVRRKRYAIFIAYRPHIKAAPKKDEVVNLGYLEDEGWSELQISLLKEVLEQMMDNNMMPFCSDPVVVDKAEKAYLEYLEKIEKYSSYVTVDFNPDCKRLRRLQKIYEKKKRTHEDLLVVASSIEPFNSRSVGAEIMCLDAYKKLGIGEFLEKKCGFNKRDVKVASAQIISRAIYPYSELRTSHVLQEHSSICELLDLDESIMNKDRLYRMAKRLSDCYPKLEDYLRDKVNDRLFANHDETLFILDTTNFHFEGRMLGSEICKHGRSKNKRYDCKIVAIALVVDRKGFIVRSMIIPGNTQDVVVLKKIVEKMHFTIEYDEKKIVVIDCGFASASNLRYLDQNGYDYITVMRYGTGHKYETLGDPVMQETDGGKQVIKLQKIRINYPTKREINFVDINIEGQPYKIDMNSRAVRSLQRKIASYSEELDKLHARIEGKSLKMKKKDKIENCIRRLNERYSKIAACYQVSITYDTDDVMTSLSYTYDEEKALSIIIGNAKKFTPDEAAAYEEEHEVVEDNVLLVDSYSKELKESSMLQAQMDSYQKSLDAIIQSIGGKGRYSKEKFYKTLGALAEKFPHGAQCYDLDSKFDDNGYLCSLTYSINEEKRTKAVGKHGKYLLRTSIEILDEKTIWLYYNIIRTVEESFKVLKSDLNLRPNYHKLDVNIIAHINLSLLSYWIVAMINYILREGNYRKRWDRLCADAVNLRRSSVSAKTKDNRYVEIRANDRCTKDLKPVYNLLGISYNLNRRVRFVGGSGPPQNNYPSNSASVTST